MLKQTRKLLKYGLLIPLFFLSGMSSQAMAESYAVIGNIKNDVSEGLARQQASRLFLKQHSKWSNGLASKVFDRREGSVEHNAFRSEVLNLSEGGLTRHWLSLKQKTGETPPRIIASTSRLVRIIKKHKGALAVIKEEEVGSLPFDVRVLFKFNH